MRPVDRNATFSRPLMTSLLRRYAAAAIAALGFSLPASATSFSTDWTDLYFNPQESGWGINLIQQYNVIFATMFVYGADRTPHWFVADNMTGSGNSFSGTLLQTSGPAFSGPFTGGVTATPVGTITITFTSQNTATLSYTANGANVVKQIQRQTWRGNNLGGKYIGGMVSVGTGPSSCAGEALAMGDIFFTHNNFSAAGGGTVSIRVEFTPAGGGSGVCTYTGTHTAGGRLGTISGNYTCTAGTATSSGSFTMAEALATRNGFNATYSANDNLGCNYSGFFGGVRDTRTS